MNFCKQTHNHNGAARGAACISFAALLFFCFSCGDDINRNELLYSRNNVYARSAYCKVLADDADVPEIPASQEYSVLVMSDLHFHDSGDEEKYEKIFAELDGGRLASEKKPLFCINLGDSADSGLRSEYERFASFVKRLEDEYGIRTYTIAGNHDLFNSGWENYKTLCYPYASFYKFETPEFAFYFLDTADGTAGRQQLALFKSALRSDSKAKIVCSHFPLYAQGDTECLADTEERNSLIAAMAKNGVKLALTGHTHRKHISDLGTFTEYNIPAYLSDGGFAAVHVNEKTCEVSCDIFYLE
ncbi:MAG: metallophosphoesterase [Bacteroides sp.]|nr:metallophosphoesterase [Prevotella sp.]MCM1408198.1 metallophosphoesterase [Treponema brennaborense]MCM1469522.1 metallophosphoesterase [Bacteroides sp.]